VGGNAPWLTVVELPAYVARAEKLLTVEERTSVIDMLAKDPTCGDVIRDTNGVRKLRVPASGRGKRGGARVIYYFHNGTMPVLLYTIYAKNEKAELSAGEKRALGEITAAIRREAIKRRRT